MKTITKIQDEDGISEELSYLHVFVFQENPEKVNEIMRSSFKVSDYAEAQLTQAQRDWLFTQARYRSFSSIGKEEEKYHNLSDWKIYSSISYQDGHSYVMPFHNRGNIDVNFGEELLEISKFSSNEIFYFWREHETYGYEIFKNGSRVKSIVEYTHGPGVIVDGQEVFCVTFEKAKPNLRVGKQLIDGNPIEVNEITEGKYTKYHYNYSYPYKNTPKFFPESVFDYLENTLLKKQGYILNPEKNNIIFAHKNIVNIDDYINEANKLMKSSRTGCAIFFYGVLALIALGVLFRILKGK